MGQSTKCPLVKKAPGQMERVCPELPSQGAGTSNSAAQEALDQNADAPMKLAQTQTPDSHCELVFTDRAAVLAAFSSMWEELKFNPGIPSKADSPVRSNESMMEEQSDAADHHEAPPDGFECRSTEEGGEGQVTCQPSDWRFEGSNVEAWVNSNLDGEVFRQAGGSVQGDDFDDGVIDLPNVFEQVWIDAEMAAWVGNEVLWNDDATETTAVGGTEQAGSETSIGGEVAGVLGKVTGSTKSTQQSAGSTAVSRSSAAQIWRGELHLRLQLQFNDKVAERDVLAGYSDRSTSKQVLP